MSSLLLIDPCLMVGQHLGNVIDFHVCRWFFQQLISAVDYLHKMVIASPNDFLLQQQRHYGCYIT